MADWSTLSDAEAVFYVEGGYTWSFAGSIVSKYFGFTTSNVVVSLVVTDGFPGSLPCGEDFCDEEEEDCSICSTTYPADDGAATAPAAALLARSIADGFELIALVLCCGIPNDPSYLDCYFRNFSGNFPVSSMISAKDLFA